MATKTTVDQSFDMTHVPMYFAEQAAELLLGPFVSRLTFGVTEENEGDFPRPVVTIAIPTIALMQLVEDLKNSFDSPSFKHNSVEAHLALAKRIENGVKPTPSNQIVAKDPGKSKTSRAITGKL